MIHQWEIFHSPSERDPNRHRVSLWSGGQDVAKLRNLFPGRVGAVWVPHRKPYSTAFFIYHLKSEEKDQLEEMLSGKIPFPEAPPPVIPAKAMDERLTKEDTQEVLIIDHITGASSEVSSGLGGTKKEKSVFRIGYFVPDTLPTAGEVVQTILERTLYEKKVSVVFQKVFSASYGSLALPEIHQLIKLCQEHQVNRAIAVGESGKLEPLVRIAKGSGVFVQPLEESVLDRNLWVTMIAEILSYE